MKRKLTITLTLAAVACICWFCISALSATTNSIETVTVSPEELEKLLIEFEEWRTNNVLWLGSPITGQSVDGGPAKGLMDQKQRADVQIGLRRDGVVVWRMRK